MVVRANLQWLRTSQLWLPKNYNLKYLKNISQLGCVGSEKRNVKHSLFGRLRKDHKMEECRTEAEEFVVPVRWSFLSHRYCCLRTCYRYTD